MAKRLVSSLTIVLLTVALAAPSHARRKRPRKGSVALFPVTGSHEDILAEVNRILEQAVRDAGIPLTAGPALKRRVKGDPAEVAERCSGDAACLGKLAKKARTELVVAGVTTGSGAGVLITFQVVTNRGRAEREATVEIAAVDGARDALAGAFETLFQVPPPGSLTGETAAAVDAMGDLDLVPVDEIPTTEGTELVDPLAEPEAEPEPEPDAETDGVIELRDPLEDDPNIEPEYIPPTPVVPAGPVEPKEPSEWLFYTSIAVAGGGVLLVGTGSVFGIQSMTTVSSANNDSDMDQIAAGQAQEDANTLQSRANLFYIIGGALAAVGGVLFAVDMFSGEEVEPEPSLSLTPEGAAAAVRFRF